MKKLILIVGILLIASTSCQISDTTDNTDVKNNLTYFKDEKTGLCFATVNSHNTYGSVSSITCVPCDSLITLGIK